MTYKPVYVQCHNRAPECVEATETTLRSLPARACEGFTRDSAGKVIVDDSGWVEGRSWNVGFLTFAVSQQGYARGVSETMPASYLALVGQVKP